MIIDFHTHIFPDAIAARSIAALEAVCGVKAATDGTLQGLLDSMERSGVDLSVILPVVTKPSQFDTINNFAAEVNEKYAGRLLSFGGIHPDCEDPEGKLDRIKELGLPGIKIHPDYQGVMIDDERYLNIISYADKLGLIIVTHAGVDVGYPEPVHCPPDRARRMLDLVGPAKFVLAHMGGWQQWDQVYELLAGQQVYLDTAFCLDRSREGRIPQEMWEQILAKHDPDKLLFATDSPWSDAVGDIAALQSLVPDPEQREDILWRNARKLLEKE